MPEFRVRYEIDVECESAFDAAVSASEIMRDPASWRFYVEVRSALPSPGQFGPAERFDLMELSDAEYAAAVQRIID